jgi:hypothetical protein
MKTPTPVLQKTPFAIDPNPLSGALTPFAGLSAHSRVFRSLGLPHMVAANLPPKQRQRGLEAGQYLESISLLQVAGGECKEDMERLRGDTGLGKILGYCPPSARATGDFLERFHNEEALHEQRAEADAQGRLALLVEENGPLQGLGRVLNGSVRAICRQYGDYPREATVDEDATIIESNKATAYSTYQGNKGYQPVVACWAEMGLILADEFRDGNVPANMAPRCCAQRAFAALPSDITTYYYRADSASDEQDLIHWLCCEDREEGPKGTIHFAVSARVSEELAKALRRIPEREWTTFDQEDNGLLRQWAEVDFVPSNAYESKSSKPLRYIGLRLVKPQGELFADGEAKKHFAIKTNRTEDGAFLLRWHRLKAGTIEHIHDEVKNGLGGRRMPSQKFGANAAWFRIACITYNLIEALRHNWPEEELRTAKLKRLRFAIFSHTGRVVRDRRKISLRLAAAKEWIRRLLTLFESFPLVTRSTG